VDVAEIATLAAALTAILALLLNAYQLSRQRKEQRMTQITRLHERFYDDPDIQHVYRLLERGGTLSFDHPPGTKPGTLYFYDDMTERRLDKVLGLFEIVARMYKLGLLGDDEIALLAYEYLTVHQNPGIQDYLELVEKSHEHLQREFRPVPYFRDVGDTLQARYRFRSTPPSWTG
jgi:hypothetical protein